jgi:hypothetical protein
MSACLSVCLSVRPHGTTRLAIDGFEDYSKNVEDIQLALIPDKNKRYIYDRI